jgi:hypothetical protein
LMYGGHTKIHVAWPGGIDLICTVPVHVLWDTKFTTPCHAAWPRNMELKCYI